MHSIIIKQSFANVLFFVMYCICFIDDVQCVQSVYAFKVQLSDESDE